MPIIKIEEDEMPSAFVRPVIRRNKPKAVRPLSENIDYNVDIVEKLEAPTLRRVMSLGPEERFKRSSLRFGKLFRGTKFFGPNFLGKNWVKI